MIQLIYILLSVLRIFLVFLYCKNKQAMIKPNKFTMNSTQVIPVGLEIIQWSKILFQMIDKMKT